MNRLKDLGTFVSKKDFECWLILFAQAGTEFFIDFRK